MGVVVSENQSRCFLTTCCCRCLFLFVVVVVLFFVVFFFVLFVSFIFLSVQSSEQNEIGAADTPPSCRPVRWVSN